MVTEVSSSRIVKGLSGLLAAAALTVAGFNAQAAFITTQGSWYGTDGTDGALRGRDINGNPVNLLNAAGTAPNPVMVFVWDRDLNLTWLADWNVNSMMTWGPATTAGTAMHWAANLTVGTFSDWSLPGVLDIDNNGCVASFPGNGYSGGTDCGYNVYSGETQRRASPLAHMFYDTLGNLAYCPPGDADCNPAPQAGWGLTNTGPFSNMQRDAYWSGTAYAPDPTIDAWYFNTHDGIHAQNVQNGPLYAVAVRPGDVFVGSVPEPGGLALLLTGLGALAAARRRRIH